MTRDEIKSFIGVLRSNLQVKGITCSRTVRGRGGNSFVSFSTLWETDVEDGDVSGGMNFKQAEVASLILGMRVDLAAFQNAASSNIITGDEFAQATNAIKQNYNRQVMSLLEKE